MLEKRMVYDIAKADEMRFLEENSAIQDKKGGV